MTKVALALCVGVLIAVTGVASAPAAAQEGASVRLQPVTQSVEPGAEFELEVVQDVAVQTTGLQTDIVFDPEKLSIVEVLLGDAYSDGQVTAGGVSGSIDQAIDDANSSGRLNALLASFGDDDGNAEAGEAVALVIVMRAKTTGIALIKLDSAGADGGSRLIDESGAALNYTASGASVTIAPGAGGGAAGETATPSSGSAGSETPAGGAGGNETPPATDSGPVDAAASSARIDPSSIQVDRDATTTVDLVVNAPAGTTSIDTAIAFDASLLQIDDIRPGPAWQSAPEALASAADQANISGQLASVFTSSQAEGVPAGPGVLLTLTLRGLDVNGESAITLVRASAIDVSFVETALDVESGSVTVGSGAPPDRSRLLLVIGALAAVSIFGALLYTLRRLDVRLEFRAWPRVVSFMFAMVPVAAVAFIVYSVGVKGAEALTNDIVGPREVFGSVWSVDFQIGGIYGLRGAIWGSVMIVVLSLALALPVALCMALISTEFPLGPLGRMLSFVLGVLAGIPPVVYALLAVVFVAPFMSQKFTAGFTYQNPDPGKLGLTAAEFPPDGLPWYPGAGAFAASGQTNSTLLAVVLLALLVIPFIAPMIEDALKGVPSDPKEASLALGANRWHTLRRVTLPRAMPGIVAAATLGALKVLGDVMIVIFVISLGSQLPDPLWDPLERTAPLTSVGAGLIGGVNTPPTSQVAARSVGYFAALLLLGMALLIVVTSTLLQARLRRRLAS